MAGYRPTQIRKPANETEFEKNCVVLFRELLNDPNTKRVGTKGQRQKGLDVIGNRNRDPKQLVGIQCKLKSGKSKLSKTEAAKEIKKALTYKPHLREYFIVATSKDDIKLQQYAQAETQRLNAAGRKILIEIWGWDTLQERIDQSEAAREAFDPGFSPSIASQNKKLDALLSGQKTQASKAQVDALAKSLRRDGPDQTAKLPPAFADRELRDELSKVLRRRGFAQSNPADELTALADRAIAGDLSLGSAVIRAEVCDRAARGRAAPETLKEAKRLRKSQSNSTQHGTCSSPMP